MKSWFRRLILVFLLFTTAFPALLCAQERRGHVTLILLVDKSLSMRPYIEEVKTYLEKTVLGEWLKPGDSVALFTFYGSTHLLVWDSPLKADQFPSLEQKIRAIQADGRFTDIGTALDTYENWAQTTVLPPWRRFVLLLTDERQEAPPSSPYQSGDYKIHHPLLKGARIVSHGGWKAITVDTVSESLLTSLMHKLSPLFSTKP